MSNSSRTWIRRENATFAESLPSGSRVLDAGAGEQPYRDLFGHCLYEAADFEAVDKPYAKSTYVCDLASVPVGDAFFDAIVCNQVLEHVPEPQAVLDEFYRLLKPGGRILLTAPLLYPEHEQPYDYFRYTQFAWRLMLSKAGLSIERLEWLEGYLGALANQLEFASRYLPNKPKDISPGLSGYVAALVFTIAVVPLKMAARMLYSLDEKSRYTKAGFPVNYLVVGRKPAS